MESRAGDTNVTMIAGDAYGTTGSKCHPSLASTDGRRSRLTMLVLLCLLVTIPLLLAAALVVQIVLSGRDISQTLHIPGWLESRIKRDEIAYPFHVMMARGIRVLGLSPLAEGLQWLKAAAHATTDEQIRAVGEGLRATVARAEADRRAQITEQFCQVARRGSQPSHSMVVALSGLDCSIELSILGHVPDDQPIYYQNIPPMGGPHYGSRYPAYGVVTSPVAPGYWGHNLEHGAVVLLYRCDRSCSDLIARLEDLYASLPPNRNSRNGQARLLALPYPDLPAPLAVVSWGDTLLLDQFDAEVIRDLYEQRVDQGPECRSGRCPE